LFAEKVGVREHFNSHAVFTGIERYGLLVGQEFIGSLCATSAFRLLGNENLVLLAKSAIFLSELLNLDLQRLECLK
jgi:hypothetical protein